MSSEAREVKPFRESQSTPQMEARREEARWAGECLNCFGSGFVWQYDAPPERRLQTTRGDAAFEDGRGMRYLVPCGCKREPRQAPLRVR